MEMEIPKGNTRDDVKARRQIIKEIYGNWVKEHPEKKVWNASLNAYIHVKYQSFNEILGHAPRSFESTHAITQMTAIMSNATFLESRPPKPRDKNQKSFSKMSLLRWKQYRLLVGNQESTGEQVLYYIGGGPKKRKK